MGGRKLGSGALTAALVTGALIALTPAPASAASDDITSPSRGAVITGGPSVLIAADLDLAEEAELRLRGPADSAFSTLDKGMGGDLRYRLDISCPGYDRACAGRRPAPNGTYTIRVVESGLLAGGGVEDQQVFTLRIPPAPPEDVSIRAVDPDSVRLRWDRGDEPDLAAYEVIDAAGAQVKRVPAEEACRGSVCATRVPVPGEERGGRVSYAVRSYRDAGPSASGTLVSPPSTRVAVTLPGGVASPPPRVGGRHSADLVTGESAGTSPEAARRAAPREGASLEFRPLASHLPAPEVGDPADRTFPGMLGNPLPALSTPAPTPRHQLEAVQPPVLAPLQQESPPRSMTAAIGMGPSEWWRTVAVGLVLLLVAAHLGAWTWRTRPEPPRGNPVRRRGSKSPATALAAEQSRAVAESPPVGAADEAGPRARRRGRPRHDL